MKMSELKQIVESLGCEMKYYSSWIFIMLLIEFPWYGKQHDEHECDNSRIIAQVTNAFGPVKWLDGQMTNESFSPFITCAGNADYGGACLEFVEDSLEREDGEEWLLGNK